MVVPRLVTDLATDTNRFNRLGQRGLGRWSSLLLRLKNFLPWLASGSATKYRQYVVVPQIVFGAITNSFDRKIKRDCQEITKL